MRDLMSVKILSNNIGVEVIPPFYVLSFIIKKNDYLISIDSLFKAPELLLLVK